MSAPQSTILMKTIVKHLPCARDNQRTIVVNFPCQVSTADAAREYSAVSAFDFCCSQKIVAIISIHCLPLINGSPVVYGYQIPSVKRIVSDTRYANGYRNAFRTAIQCIKRAFADALYIFANCHAIYTVALLERIVSDARYTGAYHNFFY